MNMIQIYVMFAQLHTYITYVTLITDHFIWCAANLSLFDFLAPPAERQRSFSNADSSVVRRRRPSVSRPSSTFQLKA